MTRGGRRTVPGTTPPIGTTGVVGVDLDNTIISYDDVIHRRAVEDALVPADTRQHKKTLRDLIRRHEDGEQRWVEIQAYIYGEGMALARPFDGALAFLRECRRRDIATYIVSHKTQYAAFGGRQIGLREQALAWLDRIGIFDTERYGLGPERVFFESTRDAKVERIRALGCMHFIDDLEEVFMHPSFPAGVERLLFDPYAEAHENPRFRVFTSWQSLQDHFFGDAR
jgi:hypothetical protein